MACRAVILESAAREYEQVASCLADVLGSPSAAASFVDEFGHQLSLVRESPEVHALSRMPELAARGYRAMLVGGYAALCKADGDAVVAAHVFHQSQGYARLV